MLALEFWLLLVLGQYNINFYEDCTLILQKRNLIEYACILPTGNILPVIVEFEEKENSNIPLRSRSRER